MVYCLVSNSSRINIFYYIQIKIYDVHVVQKELPLIKAIKQRSFYLQEHFPHTINKNTFILSSMYTRLYGSPYMYIFMINTRPNQSHYLQYNHHRHFCFLSIEHVSIGGNDAYDILNYQLNCQHNQV